ncbi:MAG: hypothetical protein J2P43_12670, partial [Candidatus Dormibacteraeota bacterium]|nr:hypothetical protein [Candidatus Dormibacteraeota bacterium]
APRAGHDRDLPLQLHGPTMPDRPGTARVLRCKATMPGTKAFWYFAYVFTEPAGSRSSGVAAHPSPR